MSKTRNSTYTVSITFNAIDAKTPLEAAKLIAKWLKDDADSMVYDIENELTKGKFTVDLAENDEDAVLPND